MLDKANRSRVRVGHKPLRHQKAAGQKQMENSRICRSYRSQLSLGSWDVSSWGVNVGDEPVSVYTQGLIFKRFSRVTVFGRSLLRFAVHY